MKHRIPTLDSFINETLLSKPRYNEVLYKNIVDALNKKYKQYKWNWEGDNWISNIKDIDVQSFNDLVPDIDMSFEELKKDIENIVISFHKNIEIKIDKSKSKSNLEGRGISIELK